jgi:hypothetical protein
MNAVNWIVLDSSNDIPQAEKRVMYNTLMKIADVRYQNAALPDNERTLLNVTTGQRVVHTTITYDSYNAVDYPIFGTCMGKINQTSGYGMKVFSFRETTDGKWACEITPDFEYPAEKDDDGNIINGPVPISPLELTAGCPGTTVETEPDWK